MPIRLGALPTRDTERRGNNMRSCRNAYWRSSDRPAASQHPPLAAGVVMTSDRSPASSRLLTGALGGLVGTAAMTAAMRRLHGRLHEAERYPLPPREIIQSVAGRTDMERRADESDLQDLTLVAHFAYGAAAGALYAVARPSDGIVAGAGYGLLVWAASYLGWIPGVAILEPATRHPRRRNELMLAAHVVWGATTALTIRELERAEAEVFAGRAAPDAPYPERGVRSEHSTAHLPQPVTAGR
jgi:uncharacterized membrane protein YagU involved in acid resistance